MATLTLEKPPQTEEGRKFWLGSLFIGAGRCVALGLGFAVNLLLVRIATKANVGNYYLLLQAINAAVLFSHLGLSSATLRFLPLCRSLPEPRQRLLRTLFSMQATMWLAVGLVLGLTWPWIATQLNATVLRPELLLTIAAIGLISFNHLFDSCFRALRHYQVSALLSGTAPRLTIACIFAAMYFAQSQQPLHYLALAFVGGHAVCTLGYFVAWFAVSRRKANSETSEQLSNEEISDTSYEPPQSRELVSTTVSMGLREGVSVFLVASDLFVLSWCGFSDDVAIYGVALALLQAIAILPAIANQIVPQEFSVLFKNKQLDQLESLTRTSATIVTILAMITVGVYFVVGPWAIKTLFGPGYVGCYPVLAILLVGRLVDICCGSAGFLLQMTGQHMRLLVLNIVVAVANIILSVALALSYGAIGVAIATAISLMALNLLMVLAVKKHVGVNSHCYFSLSDLRQVFDKVFGRMKRN